jgi:hypothetical protein
MFDQIRWIIWTECLIELDRLFGQNVRTECLIELDRLFEQINWTDC